MAEPKGPGHIVLYDRYKPTLYEGHYAIEAKQTITTTDHQDLTIYNYNSLNIPPPQGGQPAPPPALVAQRFQIATSQFRIDPKAINSYYPPDGYADEGRVLPHIVFNDPHLPWERPPFPPAQEAVFGQHKLPPWMALVVFDPKELKVDPISAAGLRIPHSAKQSQSGAFNMEVGKFLSDIVSKPDFGRGYSRNPRLSSKLKNEMMQSKEPVNVIFTSSSVISTVCKNPAKFRYMCHVRKLDTHGLPDGAGKDNDGLFSICVSHQSGPIMKYNRDNPPAPRPQIVHLISTECLVDADGNLVPPANDSGTDKVGLVSLFSWTYLATPPSPNNLISMMKDLGAKKQGLIPPQPLLDSILASAGRTKDAKKQLAAKKLHSRLSQGYNIVRWRTSTGEETSAFNRGPLVPNEMPRTPAIADKWPDSSNTGKEFQILDKSTGLMDLTYSSAWQLGKLLAIGDTIFSSALMRFRSTLHRRAASQVRLIMNNIDPAERILRGGPTTIKRFSAAATSSELTVPTRLAIASGSSLSRRLDRFESTPLLREVVSEEFSVLAGVVGNLARSFTPATTSANPDFEVIQNWISNKLLLSGIPFHYLVTDPSHLSSSLEAPLKRAKVELPPEALRFFYIDSCWMDCFIDGALSTANHLDTVEDTVRREIKTTYNKFLARRSQPVARYGFLLRSTVVKAIPELRVTARLRVKTSSGEWQEDASTEPDSSPIVRSTRVDDHTMLVLLNCLPEDLHSIIISQPAHQQRFVAPVPPVQGEPYRLKRLYTSGAPQRKIPAQRSQDEGIWESIPDADVASRASIEKWYDAKSRCIDVERMTADLERILPFDAPPAEFKAPVGSAVFSLELNDKSYYMDIRFPPGTTPGATAFTRQLWLEPSPIIRTDRIHSITHSVPTTDSTTLPVVIPPNLVISQQRPSLFQIAPSVSSSPLITGPRIEIPPENPSPVFPLIRDRYILSIHPSYRPAGPTPSTVPNSTPPRPLFSSHDYLPTQTTHLVDLVFSLHRNFAGTSSAEFVSSITIIIPITGNAATQGDEPLLVGPYKGQGATMVHNRRLVPLLTSAPGQLQIKLKARNSTPSGEQILVNAHTADASFVLKGCEIAATRNSVMVDVMDAGSVSRGLVKVGVFHRARRLVIGSSTRELKFATNVVKRDGTENDAAGEVV
ncbi:hypothetical protein BCR34DRAFT_597906 [Clohesyomyces aquaticus]|uniref:Uncharacterized protein n=1 Tax=Clohesyomyces aquaticus TaxID=1231657 RepID=A0A1Y2A276_9PLEO|nr:hypothetical protein BCR34DRAFT_597906 [Clohesyomyces aquaticus]